MDEFYVFFKFSDNFIASFYHIIRIPFSKIEFKNMKQDTIKINNNFNYFIYKKNSKINIFKILIQEYMYKLILTRKNGLG